MPDQRTSLGLDEDDINLSELAKRAKPALPSQIQRKVYKEAAKQGFTSREPKQSRRGRVSPYVSQFGGRCRNGMRELFQESARRMGVYDNVALELAICAFLEKQGYSDLINKYEQLVNGK